LLFENLGILALHIFAVNISKIHLFFYFLGIYVTSAVVVAVDGVVVVDVEPAVVGEAEASGRFIVTDVADSMLVVAVAVADEVALAVADEVAVAFAVAFETVVDIEL
jgi:hypothetical protein